jgi:nicotinate-nucleotide adenylyltransferase
MTALPPGGLSALIPPLPAGKRVGLLGGSFNPPHLGHTLLALSVLGGEEIDALWVLPCADHPFGKDLAPFEARVEMCKIAFARLAGPVEVVGLEAHLPSPNFTAQTLAALHAIRPGIRPLFVMGSDLLADWPKWHDTEAIARLCEVLVVPRQGHVGDEEPLPGPGFRWHRGHALPEVASAQVRAQLAGGKDIAGLLDREVLAYIHSHDLYGASAPPA